MGIVSVFVFPQTDWADELKVGSKSLPDLSSGSKFFFGLVATSVAGYLYDVKKAVDRSDTASTPKLLPAAERQRRTRLAAYFSTRANN